MTLFATFEVDGARREEEYHVGERLRDDFLNVIDLYADGHELEYVISYFQESIPLNRSSRSMIWVGDIASTIYANLKGWE